MSQMLELPDEVFQVLAAKARACGLTPAEWLAMRLHVSETEEARPLTEYLSGLTGVIDSTIEPRTGHQPSPYSMALADKFARQGLKMP